MDALAELFDDDVVIRAPEGWPEPGPVEGLEAAIRQFERLQEDWAEHEMTERSVDLVGDWVVMRLHWKVRGGASGIEMQMDVSGAWRFDDGRCVDARFSWDHADALDAAGGSRDG